ncbi:unnamed protein product [Bubo scandiacus]
MYSPQSQRNLFYFRSGAFENCDALYLRKCTLSKIFAANFSEQVVESFPSIISTGIYYGWTCVGNGDLHKMVLSIGWDPFYKKIKKSEIHIIHTFMDDFYGEILKALISAIQEDIEEAKTQLDLPEHLKLKEDNFFHLPEGKTINH